MSLADERRREPRRMASQERITWTRDPDTKTHGGWVSDVASASVAFVTATREIPNPGEVIDLAVASHEAKPEYRKLKVVRTSPVDHHFSLVGCVEAVVGPGPE